VVAAPSAGTLLSGPAGAIGDPEFRAAVAQEFDLAAEPVSDRIFKLSAEGLEAV